MDTTKDVTVIFFQHVFFVWIILLAGCYGITTDQSNDEPLIINVLDKVLYEDCHIPTSVHVPFDRVESYVKTFPKDKLIVIYCSNYACTTSHFVVHKLIKKGYTRVYAYAGGMAEWYRVGYPIEGNATAEYLTKESSLRGDDSSDIPTISARELAKVLKMV